jgi:hypothetical protein
MSNQFHQVALVDSVLAENIADLIDRALGLTPTPTPTILYGGYPTYLFHMHSERILGLDLHLVSPYSETESQYQDIDFYSSRVQKHQTDVLSTPKNGVSALTRGQVINIIPDRSKSIMETLQTISPAHQNLWTINLTNDYAKIAHQREVSQQALTELTSLNDAPITCKNLMRTNDIYASRVCCYLGEPNTVEFIFDTRIVSEILTKEFNLSNEYLELMTHATNLMRAKTTPDYGYLIKGILCSGIERLLKYINRFQGKVADSSQKVIREFLQELAVEDKNRNINFVALSSASWPKSTIQLDALYKFYLKDASKEDRNEYDF